MLILIRHMTRVDQNLKRPSNKEQTSTEFWPIIVLIFRISHLWGNLQFGVTTFDMFQAMSCVRPRCERVKYKYLNENVLCLPKLPEGTIQSPNSTDIWNSFLWILFTIITLSAFRGFSVLRIVLLQSNEVSVLLLNSPLRKS